MTLFLAANTVRGRLLRLALLLVLPGLLISTLLIWREFNITRQETETALLETARGLNQLVDRSFLQANVLLHTLAETRELQDGQLQGDQRQSFDHLARATAMMGATIEVIDKTGEILVDTALPPEAAPAHETPPPNWEAETIGQTSISSLMRDPVKGWFITVTLPLGNAGQHVSDLRLNIPSSAFQTLVAHTQLPPGWIATITDQQGLLVARSQRAERYIGLPAPHNPMKNLLPGGGESVENGVNAEDVPVVAALIRSPSSGFIAGVNAPRALIALPSEQSLQLLLGLGIIAILFGLAGALTVARGITRPIEAMARAARELGETGQWHIDTTAPDSAQLLAETAAVGQALNEASRALAERADALREFNATLATRVRSRTAELAQANAALAEQSGRLEAILDHMPIGVVVHLADGSVQYVNPEARRLMGLPLQGPINVSQIPDLRQGPTKLSADDRPSARALRGIVANRLLLTLDMPGATAKQLEVNASPIRDRQGRIILCVKTMQDVTARLEAEDARRRSQRLEAVGQLTGGVAHEFNNLLMAVSGSLDLLTPYVEKIPPEPGASTTNRAQSLLANAVRAAGRGARLTGQLLAFARQQNLQVEAVDLNRLVSGMLDLLESTLGRAIEVRAELDPSVWPAMADLSQLELVLLNLAINARDAMPQGGLLTISTGRAEVGPPARPEDPPEGSYATLRVTDTGTGMPPAVLARVFEPFFTTKDVGRGSGLGLPQVLGVAQQLGGGVSINSVAASPGPGPQPPHTGTTVTVYLPRAQTLPDLGRPVPARAEPVGVLFGANILIVDDDADVREIARVMLEELGATALEADGGAAALLHLRTAPVDLVLADLTMPQMTGLELASQMARILPHVPVVIMTGYATTQIGTQGEPSPNIRATLQKPFRAEALAAALVRELNSPTPELTDGVAAK